MLERARARDLVARERVAMKVKAAEFDKDTAQAQQNVASLAVQLAESRLSKKRLEGQTVVSNLRPFRARAGAQLEKQRRNQMAGRELCSSTSGSLRATCRSKADCVESERRAVKTSDRVGQLKEWVLSVAAVQSPLSLVRDLETQWPASGSPRSPPGSPVSHCPSGLSMPSSPGGARSMKQDVATPQHQKRRAVSVDSKSHCRGRTSSAGQCGHEAPRSLSRSPAIFPNVLPADHIFLRHPEVARGVPEPSVAQSGRGRATSCRMATGRARSLA